MARVSHPNIVTFHEVASARLAGVASETGGSPMVISRWHKFWKSSRSK